MQNDDEWIEVAVEPPSVTLARMDRVRRAAAKPAEPADLPMTSARAFRLALLNVSAAGPSLPTQTASEPSTVAPSRARITALASGLLPTQISFAFSIADVPTTSVLSVLPAPFAVSYARATASVALEMSTLVSPARRPL